ncbi:hypothetical protein NEF87_004392 [Candidatus Lokiarchaeum ossiferum]|uniref:DNA-binding protein n=1 Tax=Candidatus Lokiarchaeum ossiferum TaxID=2951803 RepID=A0ABY6HX60_9ARCH|nr:hypothetical protein NEF87_004392 [Candidatus Lokiarchaeum sp. B-35]
MSNDEDHELKRLRMQRMQAILKQKQQAEQQSEHKIPTLADKIDQVMQVLLAPNALQYLLNIKAHSVQTYNLIRQNLFPPQIVSEIDLLISYLRQGMIRRGVISVTEIQQIERQVLGIGSSITIKKQGQDAKSLGGYLKDDD